MPRSAAILAWISTTTDRGAAPAIFSCRARRVDRCHLIRERGPANRQAFGQEHLERVRRDIGVDRAYDSERGLLMVADGAQHQSRPAPGLLMASLRIEVHPDEVARFREVDHRASSPTDRL